jgi:hypothetical protein
MNSLVFFKNSRMWTKASSLAISHVPYKAKVLCIWPGGMRCLEDGPISEEQRENHSKEEHTKTPHPHAQAYS